MHELEKFIGIMSLILASHILGCDVVYKTWAGDRPIPSGLCSAREPLTSTCAEYISNDPFPYSSIWGVAHPCNVYTATAGVKVVGIWPWGPPCMTASKGCALYRFGSIRIDSTGYRSGMGSTTALRSRKALSTK